MRPIKTRLSALAVALSFALPAAAAPEWVAQSDAYAKPLLQIMADFAPESAGQFGLTGYDDKVFDLGPNLFERSQKALADAKARLQQALATEEQPAVRQDIQIMIDAIDLQMRSSALSERTMLPYFDIAGAIFQGERALLDDQVAAERRPAALARLQRYTGLAKGSTALTEEAKARWAEKVGNKTLIGPFRGEVEQNLANTARYVDGIRKLYAKYDIDGADRALATLEKQLADYDAWVRANVLPRARDDFRLPAELYANALENVGTTMPPDQLIAKAELAYGEIRNQMRALASQIAKDRGWQDDDYRSVIRRLKTEQIPNDRIEATYGQVIGQVEDIIRREHIVDLPDRPMLMRVASEAESAVQPAPHMDPPRLIGNEGERGTFVLTQGIPPKPGEAAMNYDDFSHQGGTWTLTAHEGRPGHELQFTAMVERGVSVARSLFAFNSANVEGWALYAEAEMQPYEPLEGQLFALQARLQRAARAFLDPMLNLGRITPERATEILTDEVVLSPAMAKQEVERYTFRMPGQATAYFFGYTQLMQLRSETEIALGDRFDRLAFNNFVVGQGLLPPDLLARAVHEQFIPAQLKLQPGSSGNGVAQ